MSPDRQTDGRLLTSTTHPLTPAVCTAAIDPTNAWTSTCRDVIAVSAGPGRVAAATGNVEYRTTSRLESTSQDSASHCVVCTAHCSDQIYQQQISEPTVTQRPLNRSVCSELAATGDRPEYVPDNIEDVIRCMPICNTVRCGRRSSIVAAPV